MEDRLGLHYNILWLSVIGMLYPWHEENLSVWKKALYLSRTAVLYLLISHHFVFQAIALPHLWGNIFGFVSNACVFLSVVATVGKIFLFVRSREPRRLVDMLMDRNRWGSESEFANCKRLTHKTNKIYSILGSVSFILFNVMPVSNYYIFGTIPQPMPIVTYYPFDVSTSPAKHIVTVAQIICNFSHVFTYVVTNTFYVALNIHGMEHIKLLNRNLKNLGESRFETTTSSSQNLESNQSHVQDDKMRRLQKCVEHHNYIIRFVRKVNKCYNTIMEINMMTSVLIVCLIGFTVVESKGDPTGFMKFIIYLYYVLFEILMVCWYADKLTAESEMIPIAAYSCNWPDADTQFKKSLMFIVMRAQRPLWLTAGKFYNVSLKTFIKLLHSSYSYFALLQQVSSSKTP